MAINMHTAGKKADWERVKPEKWNYWQKIAARTSGIVTPANLLSLLGAVLVIIGFLKFGDGVTTPGLLFILFGRLADIFDGYVAHHTGTKSPLGEIIDTTLDKTTVFFGLIVIIALHLLPALFVAVIIAQSLLNAIASLIGRYRKVAIHPSQYGKLATFLAWFTILSYLFHDSLSGVGATHLLNGAVFALSYISFIFFVLLAVHSTASYISQLHTSKPHKTTG
jgi:phosphatidylglycerophosphate synthase